MKSRLVAIFLLALLMLPTAAQEFTFPAPAPAESTTTGFAAARSVVESAGFVRVLVGLETGAATLQDTAAIASAQSSLLAGFNAAQTRSGRAAGAADVVQFEHIPYVAMTVDEAGLAALAAAPGVASVEVDQWMRVDNNGTAQVGADVVTNQQYTGKGQVIAILDTGIDGNHPALKGKLVYEACYGSYINGVDSNQQPITVRPFCDNGVNVQMGAGAAKPCPAELEGCDHGTHIAGIAAGNSPTFKGVAPDARLIGIQIFSRIDGPFCLAAGFDSSPCALSSAIDQLVALERVYQLRNEYNIAAVNLSLSGTAYKTTAACEAAHMAYDTMVDKLTAAGIAVITASGNQAVPQDTTNWQPNNHSLPIPGCLGNAYAVAAVNPANNLTNFSIVGLDLDLLAPGVNIQSSVPGTGYGAQDGTSQAAPHVAGAFAVARQIMPNAKPGKILNKLKQTGIAVPVEIGIWQNETTKVDETRNYSMLRLDAFARQEVIFLTSPNQVDSYSQFPLTFTWQPLPKAGIADYRFKVKNPKTGLKYKTVVPITACAATCSATLTDFLGNGKYEWNVKARFGNGKERKSGKWRADVSFPGKATLISPPDNTRLTTRASLTLEWGVVGQAQAYQVEFFQKRGGGKPNKKVLAIPVATTACSATACTLTLQEGTLSALKNKKDYLWRVKSIAGESVSKSKKARLKVRLG